MDNPSVPEQLAEFVAAQGAVLTQITQLIGETQQMNEVTRQMAGQLVDAVGQLVEALQSSTEEQRDDDWRSGNYEPSPS